MLRFSISLTKVRDMDAMHVARVREFNRVVTERVGALNDDYLARARPLGASRVLWEIGIGVEDARSLRSKLDLDSGYLSRLLRLLETDGLIVVAPSRADSRVRAVALTSKGRSEHELLDRNSDFLAASMLTPLNATQTAELIEAMSTVTRLLTAGLVEVRGEDSASTDAQFCLGEYFAELDTRFETGFDPDVSISADVHELREPVGLFLLARLRGDPVGCGALKLHGRDPAEIKRMWVSSTVRGLGVGRRVLAELEREAVTRGVTTVRLETNNSLVEAINMYRSAGYREVPAFNDEPFAHHWFEKPLTDTSADR